MLTSPRCDSPLKQHNHSEDASDPTLLEGIQEDCQDCFSRLFHRYCHLTYEIAWRILRNRSEAEDLVQEVFLAIFEQRYRYDASRGTVKTWICQFAHYKALIRRRRLGTGQVLAYEEAADFQEGSPQSCAESKMCRPGYVRSKPHSRNFRTGSAEPSR